MGEKKGIQIEIQQNRAMTDAEVQAVALLLFTWWRREYERERSESVQSKLEKESDR